MIKTNSWNNAIFQEKNSQANVSKECNTEFNSVFGQINDKFTFVLCEEINMFGLQFRFREKSDLIQIN